MSDRSYPDISHILAAKEARREDIRRLPFGEKIMLMEALRERVRPLKEARETQAALTRSGPDPDRR